MNPLVWLWALLTGSSHRPPPEVLPGLTLDKLRANGAFIGQTGSGKTILVKRLVRAILGSGGGLFMPLGKIDDKNWIRRLLDRSGRPYVWLDQHSPHQFSPFGAVTVPGLDCSSQSVIDQGFLMAVSATTQRLNTSVGDDSGGSWVAGANRIGRNVFALIRWAGYTPGFDSARRVLASAAQTPADADDDPYRAGLCWRLCRQATERHTGTPHAAAVARVVAFWEQEFPAIPDKQRQGYLGQIDPAIDLLTTGICARLFNGPATFDLKQVVEGGIVVTDFSVGEFGELGVAINAGLKFVVQRLCLARVIRPDSPFFWSVIDEYGLTAVEGDSVMFATARSARAPTVVAVQGRETLQELWNGNSGEARVNTILGNCGTTVYTRAMPGTAEWLVKALGTRLRFTYSGSTRNDGYDEPGALVWGSQRGGEASFTQHTIPMLDAADLLTLRTGSDADGKVVACLVVPGGRNRPFRKVRVNRGEV